ncbi:hypothetical protein [Mesorhizobium sp. CN2-181]|uniref:hypothetical protein n=1 Tax=Mesorhizobium yinganensis TaxID=3157707 RepID=UPI0032B82F0C
MHQWSGLYLIVGFALVAIGIFYFAFATQLRGRIGDVTVYTAAGACGVFGGLVFAALAILR